MPVVWNDSKNCDYVQQDLVSNLRVVYQMAIYVWRYLTHDKYINTHIYIYFVYALCLLLYRDSYLMKFLLRHPIIEE